MNLSKNQIFLTKRIFVIKQCLTTVYLLNIGICQDFYKTRIFVEKMSQSSNINFHIRFCHHPTTEYKNLRPFFIPMTLNKTNEE